MKQKRLPTTEYAIKKGIKIYELYCVWGIAEGIRPSNMTLADVDRFIEIRAGANGARDDSPASGSSPGLR